MFRIPSALLTLALAASLAPPLAAQSPSTPSLDPAGVYDLDFEMHGQVTGAVMTITREKDGRLTALLEIHGQALSFDRVTVEDQTVKLESGPELLLTLTFKNGDTISGSWTRSDGSGGISGVRRTR